MAYDEKLAERIRTAMREREDVVERKMFGGLAFLVDGSMAIGVMGDGIIARVRPDHFELALGRPHASVFDFTGRPMRGFVAVAPAGVRTAATLRRWIDDGIAVATSPEQKAKQRKAKKAKAKRPKPFPKRRGDAG
jgi:TfoX/Sxy family transcriptional regulator of competence genes